MGEVFRYTNEYKETAAIRTKDILSMRVAKSGSIEIMMTTGHIVWAGENIGVMIERWANAEHSMHQ